MRARNSHNPERRGAPMGQHFLTRPAIAGFVADAVPLTPASTVFEVGPGHGILTRELLARAGKVLAIEKDPSLVTELSETFAADLESGNLSLIAGDIRNFSPDTCTILSKPYTVCANIPYYLTGYIIRLFLTAQQQPVALALLMQKEVAERIVARNGKHSLLSLSVHAYGTPRIAHIVKAGAFSPPPKVDSAILAVAEVSRNRFTGPQHEKTFFTLLHTAFASKRKQIGSTLATLCDEHALAAVGIPKTARPEDVRLEEWIALSGR